MRAYFVQDGIVNAVSLWYLGYGLYLLFVRT